MKIEVKRYYYDSELKKGCVIGEIINVTKKHGELLVASKYGVEKKEEKPRKSPDEKE